MRLIYGLHRSIGKYRSGNGENEVSPGGFSDEYWFYILIRNAHVKLEGVLMFFYPYSSKEYPKKVRIHLFVKVINAYPALIDIYQINKTWFSSKRNCLSLMNVSAQKGKYKRL